MTESLGTSPGALPSGGSGFPVGMSFPYTLSIELKVHSPAQDGVLLSSFQDGVCSVCFLLHNNNKPFCQCSSIAKHNAKHFLKFFNEFLLEHICFIILC